MAGATVHAAVPHALRLCGKVALVTGGARGIGEATVKTFVAHGAKVIVADIRDQLGEKLVRDLGGPDVARYVHCDVRHEEQIAAAIDSSVSSFGGLDILHNNAGCIGPLGPLAKTPVAELDELYAVVLRSAILGVKHGARVMIAANKGGAIINTASVAAIIAGRGPHAYTVCKHGLIGLTSSAAGELRQHQIRVNSISPGAVRTSMAEGVGSGSTATPEELQRFADDAKVQGLASYFTDPQQIANAALFLASDDAAYITGHNLVVDGSDSVFQIKEPMAFLFR